MFQGFPEIKEALMSNKMQAAFMVAPMAIALRAQGVPVKIVYLGHRYGSAVVVRKDGAKQIAVDGKPLYTYVGDSKAGEFNGDGLGGIWHIVLNQD